MLPGAPWLMLSSGLAVGTSGAALGLAAHSAFLSAGLALLAPFSPRKEAVPAPIGPRTASAFGPEAASAGLTLQAQPVVSIADGRPAAAVALEASFRSSDGDELEAAAVEWQRIPPRLLARLDGTVLARGHALARRLAEAGRRETVILGVAGSSLADPSFLGQLARLLVDDATGPGLLVLARGGPEAGQVILGLPPAWHHRLGLQLTAPPADEHALRRCLELPLGCLEVRASLLETQAPGAALTSRLVHRLALGPVPVVVSGVAEERVARFLKTCPSLFARGSWFARPAALAA